MNKSNIVDFVAKTTGQTKAKSTVAVTAVLEAIKSGLVAGDKIKLTNFGSFDTDIRKAYIARNPGTQEPVPVPEKIVVKFKPSNFLKKLVNPGVDLVDDVEDEIETSTEA